MEIRVEERLTGRDLRARILAKYESRAKLDALARQRRAIEARNDRAVLQLLDEDPRRLDDVMHVADVTILDEEDLERFTERRLRILRVVFRSGRSFNVTGLAGHLGRDKKNVSEDVRILERMGLLRTHRRGREKIVDPGGNVIQIAIDQ